MIPSHEILYPLVNYYQELHVVEHLESATLENISLSLNIMKHISHSRFISNSLHYSITITIVLANIGHQPSPTRHFFVTSKFSIFNVS